MYSWGMRGSKNFRQRGSRLVWQKKLWQPFFFFFGPQLILQESNGQFQGNLSFFKVPGGSNIFQGGPTFSRGVQLLVPYKNPYNLWFPGGGGVRTPCPPLWIRTCMYSWGTLNMNAIENGTATQIKTKYKWWKKKKHVIHVYELIKLLRKKEQILLFELIHANFSRSLWIIYSVRTIWV